MAMQEGRRTTDAEVSETSKTMMQCVRKNNNNNNSVCL